MVSSLIHFHHTLFNLFNDSARLVGGCVRDCILDIQSFDYDVAVNMHPNDLISFLNNHHIPFNDHSIQYGAVTATIDDKTYQLTCLRKDTYCDGRYTIPEFGVSFEMDSNRRDFTMNAMYVDHHGQLYDYHDGKNDLYNGIIQFIGNPNERITEDYLRIMRYFRMMAHFSKQMSFNDIHTLNAIDTHKNGLKNLSVNRIQNEFFKIITAPRAHDTLKLMNAINLFDGINPFDNLTRVIAIHDNFIPNPNPLMVIKNHVHINDLKALIEILNISKIQKNFLLG
jgi:poly(A) polymerase